MRTHRRHARARSTLAAVIAALAAVTWSGFFAGTASAGSNIVPGSQYAIYIGVMPEARLDADSTTLPANGTKVQLWGPVGGPNQRWIFHYHSVSGYSWYTITNVDGGQCLDADSTTIPANGTKVQMWTCNGWSNQNWELHSQGGDIFTITNEVSNQCLDADLRTAYANGTKVQLWNCNGWFNQSWVIYAN